MQVEDKSSKQFQEQSAIRSKLDPMQQKIQLQNLLRLSLDRNQILQEMMDQEILVELAAALQIDQSAIADRKDCLNKIKDKIVDILIEWKELWSKMASNNFNTLSQPTVKTLFKLMETAWEQANSKNSGIDNDQEKYMKYICHSGNLKQIQLFHCSMLAFIKTGYFLEGYQTSRIFGYPQFDKYGPKLPRQQVQNYSRQQFLQNKLKSKNKQDSLHVKMQENIFNNPPQNILQREFLFNTNDPLKLRQGVRNKNESKGDKKNKDLNDCEFSSCICKGKVTSIDNYFTCDQCRKKFHTQCLKLPTVSLQCNEVCPKCLIKSSSVFFEAIGEPIDSFWTDSREIHKKRFTIKSRRCRQLLSRSQLVRITIMKIERESYFKDAPNNSKRKFKEVFINGEALIKNLSEDFRISLEIMKIDNMAYDYYKQPILLFVSMNVVRHRYKSELMKMHYDSCEEGFLDQCLGNKQQIGISIMKEGNQLMNVPVRGCDCQHSDVFDLEQFVDSTQGSNKQKCMICSKDCPNFKIDKNIETQINKIKEQIKDPKQYPSSLLYSESGFKWLLKQEQGDTNRKIYDNRQSDYIVKKMEQ